MPKSKLIPKYPQNDKGAGIRRIPTPTIDLEPLKTTSLTSLTVTGTGRSVIAHAGRTTKWTVANQI